ncbi:MAG: ATP-binding protein, partial [Halobacteriales archaeon]
TVASVLGVVLLVVGLVAGVVVYRGVRSRRALERTRDRAVSAARDAGVGVDAVDEIAPALTAFREERSTADDRLTRATAEAETQQERIERLEERTDELAADIDDAERRLAESLSTAGVDDLEVLADIVERRAEHERTRDLARTSLVDALDDPPSVAPPEAIEHWRDAIATRRDAVDRDDVDASAYDPDRLAELEREADALDRELDAVEAALREYDRALDAFDRRVERLDAGPFDAPQPHLEGRSTEALESLARDLDGLVEAIERDAERSRLAIELFDDLDAEEERKLTDLFDPSGPASTAFARITDGRYETVGYDPEAHHLAVTRADGRSVPPAQLSRGTRDQLYFASRVGLADRLLDGEAGFFLLDDPLAGADPDRLHRGFATLCELADEGWQIVYLTAKAEVYDGMVDAFDLEHASLPSVV